MKIKKSLLTGLAVLALFGAGVSVSVSSVNSVEANAAVHHKNSKKHKKARKSVKKHKKAKKTVKKHKKVAKKSKKRVAKKAAKKSVKKPVAKKAKVHTIVINDGDTTSKVKYNNKITKSYDNVDLNVHNNDSDSKHDIKLRNITYYNLYGDSRYKTAVTLKVSFFNEYRMNEDIDTPAFLKNDNGDKLFAAWGGDSEFDTLTTVTSNSHQFVNLTFYSSKRLPLSSFDTFDFAYTVDGGSVATQNCSATINY